MRPTASTFIHFLGHFFRTRFWDTFFCIFFLHIFHFWETFLGHLFCNFWYTFWDTCSTSQYHIWYPWSACFSQKLWILLSAPLGLGPAFYFFNKMLECNLNMLRLNWCNISAGWKFLICLKYLKEWFVRHLWHLHLRSMLYIFPVNCLPAKLACFRGRQI